MKYPYDLDFTLRDYAKDNCVAACGEFSVSFLDMIAGEAGIGTICKENESNVELLGIKSTLLFTPLSLRVDRNRLQVSSGCIGKGICPH
jgi:hypothetical protein